MDHKDVAVKKIFKLFKEFGSADYVSNNVSLMDHSLQAAQLAIDHFKSKDDQTVDTELVVGSLLHDFGKVVQLHNTKMGMAVPDRNGRNHEMLGAEFLASMGFSKRVQEICKGHVKAKRYLCW